MADRISLEDALQQLSNSVYTNTALIEKLEGQGLVDGNGHHARQYLAVEAQVTLLKRWRNKDEVLALSDTHPAKEAWVHRNMMLH